MVAETSRLKPLSKKEQVDDRIVDCRRVGLWSAWGRTEAALARYAIFADCFRDTNEQSFAGAEFHVKWLAGALELGRLR